MANQMATRAKGERLMDHYVAGRLLELCVGRDAEEETRAGVFREVRSVADDLAGPHPTAIERSLADAAALAWLAMRVEEGREVQARLSGSRSFAQSEHSQRRVDRAHRRYLATLKALATVRKLALPTIQLRVGEPPEGQGKALGSKGNPLAIGPG